MNIPIKHKTFSFHCVKTLENSGSPFSPCKFILEPPNTPKGGGVLITGALKFWIKIVYCIFSLVGKSNRSERCIPIKLLVTMFDNSNSYWNCHFMHIK